MLSYLLYGKLFGKSLRRFRDDIVLLMGNGPQNHKTLFIKKNN